MNDRCRRYLLLTGDTFERRLRLFFRIALDHILGSEQRHDELSVQRLCQAQKSLEIPFWRR